MATWKEIVSDSRWQKLEGVQREKMLNNWIAEQENTNLQWAELEDDKKSTVISRMREMGSIQLREELPVSMEYTPLKEGEDALIPALGKAVMQGMTFIPKAIGAGTRLADDVAAAINPLIT